MRQLNYLWILVILIAGCASIAKPQSFDQQLAYVQSGITSVRQTATDLLARERITAVKALDINAECDKAKGYIKEARALGATLEGADKLDLATNLLLTLEAQLKGLE